MGRKPCCSKIGLNRGAWTPQEDEILSEYIRVHGEGKWRNLPKKAGLNRCGKSCRLRWRNYLRPDIKRGNISLDEEDLIIRLHKLLGNRWSLIAGRLPGRTDNEIKNYWNTTIAKKLRDGGQQTSSNNETSKGKSPAQSVIRTKASKCSKHLFIDINVPQLHHELQNETEKESENHQEALLLAPPHYVYDNAFLRDEEKRLLSTDPDDLPTDFNVGDICLSDFLESDFYNFGSCHNNNNNKSPNSDHQALCFFDEILNDWTQTNFPDDEETIHNVSNNNNHGSLLKQRNGRSIES